MDSFLHFCQYCCQNNPEPTKNGYSGYRNSKKSVSTMAVSRRRQKPRRFSFWASRSHQQKPKCFLLILHFVRLTPYIILYNPIPFRIYFQGSNIILRFQAIWIKGMIHVLQFTAILQWIQIVGHLTIFFLV
jgi:hypothetical protein